MDVQTLIDAGGGVTKLAAKLGVSHSTVLDWKRGKTIPGNRVKQLSAVLDLPLDELVDLANLPRRKKAEA